MIASGCLRAKNKLKKETGSGLPIDDVDHIDTAVKYHNNEHNDC